MYLFFVTTKTFVKFEICRIVQLYGNKLYYYFNRTITKVPIYNYDEMALVVYRMFYLDWLNLGALKGVGLTGFQVQLVDMQWFCYLYILHPWHTKSPKTK